MGKDPFCLQMIDVPIFLSASNMLVLGDADFFCEKGYRPLKNFESLKLFRILMFYQLKFMKIKFCVISRRTFLMALWEQTFLSTKC